MDLSLPTLSTGFRRRWLKRSRPVEGRTLTKKPPREGGFFAVSKPPNRTIPPTPSRFTAIPDVVIDFLMAILTGAEFKVCIYICRRTLGFNKDVDTISISQLAGGITTKDGRVLDKGTGLSRDSVARAVRSLEKRGLIIRTRHQSNEKGYEATAYSLNLLDANNGQLLAPLSENRTRQEVIIGQGASPKIGHTTNSYIQETEDKDDVVYAQLQKFGITENTARRLANNYPEDYLVDKMALAQWLVDQGSPLIAKNPAGWLRKAVEEDFKPPKDYETPSERKVKTERQAKIARAEAEQRKKADEEYRLAKEVAVARIKEGRPPEPVGKDGLTTESAWNLTLNRLQEKVTRTTYETWLKDTVLLRLTGKTAQVLVPNQITVKYLDHHYQGICRTLSDVIHQDVEVLFIAVEPEIGERLDHDKAE